MTNRVPASPSLSPGRRLFRAVPQSPALGFRAPSATTVPGASLTARHTKSTSDLNQGRPHRYEPLRIVGGNPSSRASQGGAPPPTSPRVSTSQASEPRHASQAVDRPYTPCAPGSSSWSTSGLRSSSPSSGSAPPPRQKQHYSASIWPSASAPRVSSVERRSPQWTGNSGVFAQGSPTAALEANQLPSSYSAPPGNQYWNSSPRSSAVLSGSASRSLSQSSQGRRAEPLWASQTLPQSALQAVSLEKAQDLRSQSPHMQNSRRAPSQTYLQAVSPGQTNGAKPLSDVHYEAQMASLRNSLLTHIQSVQKEITKLQYDRHGTQQPADRQQSIGMVQANGPVTIPAAVAVGLRSPQTTSRSVSAERERFGVNMSGGNLPEVNQWRGQPVRRELQTSASAQAPSGAGSMAYFSAPCEGVRAPMEIMVAAAQRIQRFWRSEATRRRKRKAAVTSARPVAKDTRQLEFARTVIKATRPSSQNGHRFVAIHHAACRIQRAWRVSRWRRRFLDFSEHEIGWVGTLDWLQHHNLLYGTELADPEDLRWWNLQRVGAPLDREVDPWGCTKLRDHLNKMWYGRSPEEISPEEAQALEAQARAHAEYLEAAERELRYDRQRLDEQAYIRYNSANNTWGPEAILGQGRSATLPMEAHSRSYSQGIAPVILRSPASTDRQLLGAIGSAVSSTMPCGVVQASSLSPRRAAAVLYSSPDGDMSSRASKSQVLGAPPPSMHASYQASPLQTHRAARPSVTTIPAAVPVTTLSASPVTSLSARPRSPVPAHQIQTSGRTSLGSSTMQARAVTAVQRQAPSLGRALSGSPPPTLTARVSCSGGLTAMATTSRRL